MNCKYTLTTFDINNNEKILKENLPASQEGSFSELKSELKKLKLSDLEKLISHVESSESLTLNNINREYFENAIGNTSFAELSETFIDDSTKSNLARIQERLKDLNSKFDINKYNIIVKQDYNQQEELYKYSKYNKNLNLIEINLGTFTKYQKIPIYKAFMDYYISNIDLNSEEVKPLLKNYSTVLKGKKEDQIRNYFIEEIYAEGNITLGPLLNFFNLNTVDQTDFRTKANITIVENLKTSYIEEAQQTLIKYKTNKEFGYGEADTNVKYEDLFNLKRGDLIKLNFGIASQNNIDEYYKTNKSKLTRIYKKQGEDLTEEAIFKYISSSSYWIVHKIKVNRNNKKIKSLELISTVEGKTLSIPLTDEKGKPVINPMLGNITSTTMEEYKEEHGKDLSQKTFTVRKFSSENSIGYLDKKSWDEIQSINQALENDISNEQRISIKNYDGVFESNNLLKEGDFFKHNGNLYKIDDISLKDNHWKVIQLNVSEFNTNNYFKVIPQYLTISEIFISKERLEKQFGYGYGINSNSFNDILVGDFIQTIENDKPKKYKITNVYRNESGEVYRFKGIDQFGNVTNFKKLKDDFINQTDNKTVILKNILVPFNINTDIADKFEQLEDNIYKYSILYPGEPNVQDQVNYNKIFIKNGETSIINSDIINKFYSILHTLDFVQVEGELYCVVGVDKQNLHVKNKEGVISTINKNDIEIIFLKHEEGRLNKDNGYFDLYEDCTSKLNSYRVVTDEEYVTYKNRIQHDENGNPIEFKCFIQKRKEVKTDMYRNIIGARFSNKDLSNKGYEDVTEQYIKNNNLIGTKLYPLSISETLKEVKATSTLGFQVMKYSDFKNKKEQLNTGMYLKLNNKISILGQSEFKGNTKVVKILEINSKNVIVGLSLYDWSGQVKTTVFPINTNQIEEYVSHVYITNNSSNYINDKINLTESYFNNKDINTDGKEKIVMHDFLKDIFKKLNIPVKQYEKSYIKSKFKLSDAEINSIKAFITYENGKPVIIHHSELKVNTLLHELLHIIFGKFKQDKPTEYKNLINLLLEEFKNKNFKSYNDYMELYKNWNEDFRDEEIVIKFLTKSNISVKLKNSSYFNNFMELLNSISPKSENINLRDALNNTVYSIFGNDYEANKFIKSDLKKDLLIESYIYKILKNSEEC